ncbi:hypothetical protein D3C87_1893120 [compost metagenome]
MDGSAETDAVSDEARAGRHHGNDGYRSQPSYMATFRGLALTMWLIVDLIPPSFDGFRALGVCSLLT